MGRRARAGDTRAWVRDVVRAGLTSAEEVRTQVVEAIAADLGIDEPGPLADAWIAEARAGWQEEARSWPAETDYDRLQRAFAVLRRAGFVVLQGCVDHWAARDLLTEQDPPPRGVLWFTEPDVWHAVEEAMLEVNLWHPSTANAAPGDALLTEALAAFADQDLAAHFDEGRIEISARWQRRPPG